MSWESILRYLPEITSPRKKRLNFNEKLKWTGMTLLLYFVLYHVPLYGLGKNALEQFESLSIILGANFGSVISLGIGPIVMASIILQLLVGSGFLGMDLTTQEGKAKFQGLQKVLTILFIVFEASIYVLMGGLAPDPALAGTTVFVIMQMLLIIQLFIGGYMIFLMDEVINKWGFGSGVGLFIVAGVSHQIFVTAFNPIKGIGASAEGSTYSVGKVLQLFQALAAGDPTTAILAAAAIIATILVFLMAVYAQAMKVEIPLSFGRMRGYGMRWPLRFLYTSNIPVILIAALMANIQLWARLLQNWGHPILGTYSGNVPASGLVKWIASPDIISALLRGSASGDMVIQAVVYTSVLVLGAVLFSVLWVKTSNMDAGAQAKQILASGLQIPGFRRDPRVLEKILNRYIPALTIMGGATVGFLAAFADLSGALARGTGILLAVMIVYRLYEDIAKQHAFDMHPALRKFVAPE